MSESLLSLFTKEQPWVNRARRLLKKRDLSDSRESFSKESDSLVKIFVSFSLLFPFLCPRANRSSSSSLSHSFLKSNGNDSLPSLFTKERPWAIRSFSWANRSFAHKNEQIARKTEERNPNPAFFLLWGLIFRNYSIYCMLTAGVLLYPGQ